MILPDDIGEVSGLQVTFLMDDYAGYNSGYLASHGISLLLDIASGEVKRRVLLDVGPNPIPLLFNMEKAGIDPSSIDMIFLSHCHYDHTFALADIVKEMKKNVMIIAHPDIFRKNFSLKPCLEEIGASDKNNPDNLVSLGGQIIPVRHPFPLMEGVISSGEVARVNSFEGKGIGTYNLVDGELRPDELLDDLSLIINLKDMGLLVVTGCSHSGIINIIEHAVNITGIEKVYGVIGGLHLVSADDQVIEATIGHLEKYNLRLLAPGHCTGIKAQYRISERFGERCLLPHSGKIISIL
ncbi:MAG: hypothetical protein HPY66_0621 [Firmicutes bacterium]|nr:hypothetical protein [Bacillota bacterium]MDI6706807.1 MBL fold metallo-hydrolase [Bacillota bacterium]